MRNTDYFKNKKVTMVGLARSGLACANLLSALGAQVSVTEIQDSQLTRENSTRLRANIKFELGKHTPDFIKNRDLLVVSPGVTNTAWPIIWARQFAIPVISEIEVAGILCVGTVIAITGTNGKTTVVTLIGKVLEQAGKRVFVCGNIGQPFCQDLEKIEAGDFVVLEVSSFQLENISTFKPKISCILNFSSNHLDRYANMQDYLQAKKRIFVNQDSSDYLILNYDDVGVRSLSKEAKANIIYFSQEKNLNPNQSAVLAVASILGINKDLVLNVFKDFKGIEHRLEEVARINQVLFINDSKATTVEATLWALGNIHQPIILIAGGREKGNDYSQILDLMRRKVREVILIGEAKERMRNAFAGILSINEASTLEEAVSIAFSKARPGESVLFSPMCKSFDMFSNFEERGRVFKETVYKIIAMRDSLVKK